MVSKLFDDVVSWMVGVALIVAGVAVIGITCKLILLGFQFGYKLL